MLLQYKVIDEYKKQILLQLDIIQQKSIVQEYNITFEKLTIQTSDLPLKVEIHYYLKRLKQQLRQLIESNRDNLRDMMTLKLACLRQDHIINPTQTGSTKKKNKETALMISNQVIFRVIEEK